MGIEEGRRTKLSARTAALGKLAIDQLFFAPLWLMTMFFFMNTMQGKPEATKVRTLLLDLYRGLVVGNNLYLITRRRLFVT